ncbi:hypothetical protein BGP75_10395 [Motiliproteus sp. MSK22-1]|nr:hypothetical protein BGP75_10395 [Motiliproteus sp. MSK22-1]
MSASVETVSSSEFKCRQCGAKLTYSPGTESLICEYCDHRNDIPRTEDDIEELDFNSYLKDVLQQESTEERLVVKCGNCGAEATSEANIVSQNCLFCDTEIVTTAQSVKVLKPRSLLPFAITRQTAKQKYTDWLKDLWFAPSSLKRKARLDVAVNGIYVPYWTYDSDTLSFYTGQRGIYYYVTETRTRTNSDGDRETYTTQVRKTRWYSVSGTVTNEFDDVLVLASESLPKKYAEELEPWDLHNLVSYKDDYLSGFKAESYHIDLAKGFENAKVIMSDTIRETIRRHIGGDEQRISSVKTQHSNVTFKHILLPVWLSAYRFQKKVYRFMVNARTGEVQGERPWSWVKITLAVLVVVGLGIGGYFGYEHFQQLP